MLLTANSANKALGPVSVAPWSPRSRVGQDRDPHLGDVPAQGLPRLVAVHRGRVVTPEAQGQYL